MKPTLVVMAAGVGSRYGGLKQIDPVGPSGEIMLDYSVFDAIRAGFGKVVFVIRDAIAKDFKAVIGARFLKRIPIEYVFQEISDLPPGFSVPADRTKPWGTGHAILRCKDAVNEPFAVINADDFYGKNAYVIMSNALRQLSVTDNTYAMAGYQLMNTLSDHGHVARGICEIGADHMLVSVVERLKIEKTPDGARYMDEREQWVNTKGDEVVSMNMFGFTPTLFTYLEQMFPAFLSAIYGSPGRGDEAPWPPACSAWSARLHRWTKSCGQAATAGRQGGSSGRRAGAGGGKQVMAKSKAEFLIPTVVHTLIQGKKITMEVLKTREKWFGVTYREDMPDVVANIRQLIDAGAYPERLWS